MADAYFPKWRLNTGASLRLTSAYPRPDTGDGFAACGGHVRLYRLCSAVDGFLAQHRDSDERVGHADFLLVVGGRVPSYLARRSRSSAWSSPPAVIRAVA